ncbi:MAG: helix-turn-helix transcriptional regulator [Pseudomonadota bacterium]
MAIQKGNASALLDVLNSRYGMKNDAALSRQLGVAPPVISKLRHGRLPVGAVFVLKIHDAFDMPIKEIREIAGIAAN